jgi:ABC-2 type transport system ATP-binding protein
VAEFSKGMQQRLGLGVALLGRPDIVFLDEPTSALDPMGRVDVRSVILTAQSLGMTVFLNSHLLTEVEKVCDRVAFVDRGRVVSAGRLDEVLGEPAVRLRVSDLDAPGEAALNRFGPVGREGEWLVIRPLPAERVPDVVEAVIAAGGRVHAVDPGRGSLEERFLSLMRAAPGPDGGAPPPA